MEDAPGGVGCCREEDGEEEGSDGGEDGVEEGGEVRGGVDAFEFEDAGGVSQVCINFL